jgi:hypothetical protein
MANTFVKIASATVGAGGASSIDFTSIPGTYTDLIILTSLRTTRNTGDAASISITFNGSSSSRSSRILYGNGSGTLSYTDTILEGGFAAQNTGTTANTFSNHQYYISNYAGSNNKSLSIDSAHENNATTAYALLNSALWSNTSAITSIKLENVGFNFVQYSTATLYGIKNS